MHGESLIRAQLISNMREHIDDEIEYLEFFKDFVQFEEHCKEGKDISAFKGNSTMMKYYSATKNKTKICKIIYTPDKSCSGTITSPR